MSFALTLGDMDTAVKLGKIKMTFPIKGKIFYPP